jgi:Glycosyltransferase family 87
MRKAGVMKSWALAWLAAMVLIHAVLLWNARELIRPGYPDFTAFYAAGASVRNGTAARLYDSGAAGSVESEDAARARPSASSSLLGSYSSGSSLPFLHPPCEALLFAPLSFLSFGTAFLAWDVLNVLLLLACGFVLRSEPSGGFSSPIPWLLAGLGFFPVFIVLLQGQDSILLLLLFTLAYCSLKRGADFAAGICLGLGLLRPQIVLPFLAMLMFRRHRGRLLGGFAAAAALLAALSAWVTNWRTVLRYPLFLLEMNRQAAGSSIFPVDMPNLRGLASQWQGLPGWIVAGTQLVLSALLMVMAGRFWRRISQNQPSHLDETAFEISVAVALLVSYHIHLHDLSLMLLPAIVLVNGWREHVATTAGFWRTALAATLGGLFCSPLYVVLMQYRSVYLAACLVLLFAIALVMIAARPNVPEEKGPSPATLPA